MEFLVELIVYGLFAYAAYMIADKVRVKNPEFNVEPALYAVGSVIFGFLWVMAFLAIKYAWWVNKNK